MKQKSHGEGAQEREIKSLGECEKTWEMREILLLGGGRESIIAREDTQATPARPTNKGSMKLKTLELKAKNRVRQRHRNFDFLN
jgi:hypothetical protein